MSSFGLPPLPPITRLTSRVWRILGLNPGPYTLQGTNTYLVGTGTSRLLIDTGAGVPGYVDNVVECMRQSGCERLAAVLVTHWHHDHTGGLGELLAHFAAAPVGGSGGAGGGELHATGSPPASPTRSAGSSLNSTASAGGDSPASPTASAPASPCPQQQQQRQQQAAAIPVYKHQPHLRGAAPPTVHYTALTPTTTLAVQGATLSAVATPGHTADHVSYLLREEHALFVGDTVLGHGTTVFRHLYDYTATLHAIAALAPLVLYPGHGEAVQDVQGKLAEYLQHRRQREAQLLRAVRQHAGRGGMTAVELVGKVYPALSEAVMVAATQNVVLVLEKLALEGSVRSDGMEAERAGGGGVKGVGSAFDGVDSGGGGAGGEWEKDYGELYESTSAMVQRKAQWMWTATGQHGSL